MKLHDFLRASTLVAHCDVFDTTRHNRLIMKNVLTQDLEDLVNHKTVLDTFMISTDDNDLIHYYLYITMPQT